VLFARVKAHPPIVSPPSLHVQNLEIGSILRQLELAHPVRLQRRVSRMGLLRLAVLLIWIFGNYPPEAAANIFAEQDHLIVDNIVRDASGMQRDLLNSRGAVLGNRDDDANRCLEYLSSNLDEATGYLRELQALITISSQMISPADEYIVNDWVESVANAGTELVDNWEKDVNLSIGQCSRNALVIIKAEGILRFYRQIQPTLQLIFQRVSDRKR
jgi:hypothetical protein